MQRATLAPFKDDAAPLKKKAPYDQLKPYKTSKLHDMQKSEQNEELTSLSDNFSSSSDSTQSFNGTPPSHTSNNTSPCDDSPILIHSSPPQSHSSNNGTDSNKTDHNKANDIKADNDNSNSVALAQGNSKKLKRGCKPNDVWKCTANKNPEKLVMSIMKEDYWLTR